MQKKNLKKILYVGMRYDYGRPEQGFSFEYTNFYSSLNRIVPELVEFDFMSIMQKEGRERMNALLLETAEKEEPDMIFFILFTDEIDKKTIGSLSKKFVTFNWFCDDHWRFHNFSKHFAPEFHFVSTTDHDAVEKYHSIGYSNVIQTQWGCNHFDYKKIPGSGKLFDVSFVGQPHGNRKKVIFRLEEQNIRVEAFGNGWENGRVSQERMVEIFNQTKVNLNLSNSSWNIRTIFRNKQQIKGRNFEVPGCGSLLLTDAVPRLDEYYCIDKEVVCFRSSKELTEKIRYYLSHDDEREAIAAAGYARTLKEHTYERRFIDIFDKMNFDI